MNVSEENNMTVDSTIVTGPSECADGYQLVLKYSGQCVVRTEQLAGFFCGLLSIIVWLVAHIVLFALRHIQYRRTGAVWYAYPVVHQALGDACNCVGAILSHQLPTQCFFGLYLLMADALFFVQTMAYKLAAMCSGRRGKLQSVPRRRQRSKAKAHHILLFPWVFFFTYVLSNNFGTPFSSMSETAPTGPNVHHTGTGRILLSTTEETSPFNLSVTMGYSLGILAAIFDTVGTLPDVLLVLKEPCCDPLRAVFYALCVLGNSLYVVSVLTQEISVPFILHTLPWIVARLLLIGTHVALMIQFCMSPTTVIARSFSHLEDEVVSLLRTDYPDIEKELKSMNKTSERKSRNAKRPRKPKDISDNDSSDSMEFNPSTRNHNKNVYHDDVDEEEAMEMDIWSKDLTDVQVFDILSQEDRKLFPKREQQLDQGN